MNSSNTERNQNSSPAIPRGIELFPVEASEYHSLGPLFDLNINNTARLVNLTNAYFQTVTDQEIIDDADFVRQILNDKQYLSIPPHKLAELGYMYLDISECLASDKPEFGLMFLVAANLVGNSSTSITRDLAFMLDQVRCTKLLRANQISPSKQDLFSSLISLSGNRISELKDGEASEYAVYGALSYLHYAEETENNSNFVRLARPREDKPSRGSGLSSVAHDLVITKPSGVLRVQLKTGSMANEFGTDKYDRSRITVVALEDFEGQDITDMLSLIAKAYKGDSDAATIVTLFAERIQDKILSNQPSAKGAQAVGQLVAV